MMKSQIKTIYVAMSGGVDSSVAAALLKKQGYDVVGVFMKPWSPVIETRDKRQETSFCLWRQDREDAMRAAAVLGIPLLTWDFSREYKKEVGDYMIREYKAGRTPNPDVMCNKEIKFGLFLKMALKEGADFIATGHYIKIKKSKIKNQNNKSKFKNIYRLFKAKYLNKDQSYFLWTLTQKQLKHCLFPIGRYTKPEVRKMAKKFGLSNHDKKDSQGVCFIGQLDMKEFLKKYIKSRAGKIIDLAGKQVGTHDGASYYTIGQRHGLNIGNGQGPYFVTGKDIKKNIIYVSNKATSDKRQATSMIVKKVNWVGERPKLSVKLEVKIRYRSESIPVIISLRNSAYQLTSLPAYQLKSVTPGQSAVFYRGEEMLGGGIIQ
ncbi:MAG: tRNA 2-thiouridine(34) synthase MnmA [Candidatus Yanofskybacteria bacterium RIFCSPHIGHO2_02_FULL_38_22b]|uniref:tRNA-specific 2-thiouridylase MnmA n=1 Tax=Candidatus Yanofskybacteria bacterium RIFCSPHIGHO2_02_FULL_38_22b TaxID=1802673 RepID=A0A1F8F437_9BACT|nr:MAG: tRNA 2-thiouridine(34) synthase MnmA [Candidatus Yanofskybacteria bacterium RIFCSPHIGHO2_02_FULL_38_22b]OGN20415.1 MAG: tRNA 2-thiouridine(34) synthase MnmA [Candidatus Yanofskybacteria bacterium RIFCSPLOWO2_01_FULL_39_28]